ncbi:MAG TPA: hypothetical protein VFJ58_25125 [Armatimonadota bacterium]|nr:hypothetical protein [Armatimonadota bacterium]
MSESVWIAIGVVILAFVLVPSMVSHILRSVNAGEILLVSWLNGNLKIFRGPCKAIVVPIVTKQNSIPASAINVDIEITDQTADIDPGGTPAPVKVTVRASAIVSVGENDAMVNTAANKFFSKPPNEQLSTLTDVLSSAGRRAINLLRHDQLFNARTNTTPAIAAPTAPALGPGTALAPTGPRGEMVVASGVTERMVERGEDDELAVIIKDACSRELLDLGLTFNSLNIKAVISEVAEARRRESAARAKANADVVQAQEEQRAKIAQLEAAQKVNDQERLLNMQIASNGAAIARAEAEKQAAVRAQREGELAANQITQARADAEQNVIEKEADGKAQAALIRAVAEAEADSIRMKAEALLAAGGLYLDLRRLELAPDLTREVATALSKGQFVNFGSTGGGAGSQSAASAGSDDVMRVVQTLMAAQVITGGGVNRPAPTETNGSAEPIPSRPVNPAPTPAAPVTQFRPTVRKG